MPLPEQILREVKKDQEIYLQYKPINRDPPILEMNAKILGNNIHDREIELVKLIPDPSAPDCRTEGNRQVIEYFQIQQIHERKTKRLEFYLDE